MGIFKRSTTTLSRKSSDGLSTARPLRAGNLGTLLAKTKLRRGNKKKQLVLENMHALKTIGKGTFGSVMLVKDTHNDEPYALKVQSKKYIAMRKTQELVDNEIELMSSIDHPLVGKLFTTFDDGMNIYMCLEYLPGGDMFTLIGNRGGILDNNAHTFYAACLVLTIEALHKQSIIYRDMKPENILIDAQGYTRLVDFGFAKRLKGRTYTACGTPDYFSPELIRGRGYGRSNDIWALGIFVYELLFGRNPFSTPSIRQRDLFWKIKTASLDFPLKDRPAEARYFLTSILEKKVADRLGCGTNGIGDIKKHEWFEDIDWKALGEKKVEAPWTPFLQDKFDGGNFDEFDSPENLPVNLKL